MVLLEKSVQLVRGQVGETLFPLLQRGFLAHCDEQISVYLLVGTESQRSILDLQE
jgi:hypothetical protein